MYYLNLILISKTTKLIIMTPTKTTINVISRHPTHMIFSTPGLRYKIPVFSDPAPGKS